MGEGRPRLVQRVQRRQALHREAADALQAVSGSDCTVCIMHKQGQPQTMQQAPQYRDVVAEVDTYLRSRIAAAEAAGIARSRLVIDPGFGFGKTLEHNLELLVQLGRFQSLRLPILVGMSRKGMLGQITGRDVDGRLAAGTAAASLAVLNGALIVRTHDVSATVDAAKVGHAVRRAWQAGVRPS